MKLSDADAEILTAALLKTFMSPPSEIGLRLRPEQELADRLAVNRWRLREALAALVDQGFLVRRRGSGTYVQRIPSENEVEQEELELAARVSSFDHAAVFAELGEVRVGAAGPDQNAAPKQTLHIGVWGNLYSRSMTTNRVQASLSHRLSDFGHLVKLQTVMDPQYRWVPVGEIATTLKKQPADGYVVQLEAAGTFLKALELVGMAQVPTIFYGQPANVQINAPSVGMNITGAIEQGVSLLAQEKFQRIALLRRGSFDPFRQVSQLGLDIEAYDQVIKRWGLPYRAVFSTKGSDLSKTVDVTEISDIDAMEATIEMLESEHPPDAVYVGDDHLMVGVHEALRRLDCVPGRDIGLITLNNRGRLLPGEVNWSRLEFSVEDLAETIIYMLFRSIHLAGYRPSSMLLNANWCPGETHRLIV